jgi:hypothetical protein
VSGVMIALQLELDRGKIVRHDDRSASDESRALDLQVDAT